MKSTSVILFITHAEVEIDPEVPVTEWRFSGPGRIRHEALHENGRSATGYLPPT